MLIHSNVDTENNSIDTYQHWLQGVSVKNQLRNKLRRLIVNFLALGKNLSNAQASIRFPFYHHVFSDEILGFKRQLLFLRNYGEFISIDEATKILETGTKIDGVYFCLTFDDGFKCCYTNALPILSELQIPATFYIVTDYVGHAFQATHNVTKNIFGFRGSEGLIEFMNWSECKELINCGMTIGSHTKSHQRLSRLSSKESYQELFESKNEIENKLAISCRHFCAPYGLIGKDFDLSIHGELAKKLGYVSFSTSNRGVNAIGASPFSILRDHLLANWENQQLKYFLSN